MNCKNCNKKFGSYGNQIYCSYKCGNIYRKPKQKKYYENFTKPAIKFYRDSLVNYAIKEEEKK